MAKVTINGEMFDFDPKRKPMLEALTIEAGLGCKYAQWEQDMADGSARALCGFVWMVWHRDGRDVSIEDILTGRAEVNLAELEIVPEEGEQDPTSLSPEASSTTGAVTSGRSRSTSGSGPGRRGS